MDERRRIALVTLLIGLVLTIGGGIAFVGTYNANQDVKAEIAFCELLRAGGEFRFCPDEPDRTGQWLAAGAAAGGVTALLGGLIMARAAKR